MQSRIFSMFALAIFTLALSSSFLNAEDWNRFRGPNGNGVHATAKNLPAEFGDDKNLTWKFKMPGPGSSCPIVVGDKVFVTCWTGYGTEGANSGNKEDLKRHLICVSLKSGEKLWQQTVDAVLPEDDYNGMMMEHGYASHTPVSDGKHVYAFFGKSGVYCYDMDGKKVWSQLVGDQLDGRRWGSACSPILFGDHVYVLASAESSSLVALNKKDGKKAWTQNYQAYAGNWSTPVIARLNDKKADLIVSTSEEVWGLNPETGGLRWYCSTKGGQGGGRGATISSSFGTDGKTFVHIGGRGGKSTAFKAGGSDDISKTHVLWENGGTASHASPIVHEGLVYSIARRAVTCLDAESGEEVYQQRLPTIARSGGNGGGGRSRFGSQDYASPVIADGKIYYVSRKGSIHVMQAGKEYKLLATNKFESDDGDFSATPAITDNHLLIRSSNYLYCVGKK